MILHCFRRVMSRRRFGLPHVFASIGLLLFACLLFQYWSVIQSYSSWRMITSYNHVHHNFVEKFSVSTNASQSKVYGASRKSPYEAHSKSQNTSLPLPSLSPTQAAQLEQGFFNVNDFPAKLDIPNVCEGEVTMIIMIFSTNSKKKGRETIRKTWLAPIVRKERKSVRYAFLLGNAKNDEEWQSNLNESKEYGDIVVFDFVEAYGNLTYKTVSGMNWIATRCPNAKFFLKADDDVWVSLKRVDQTIRSTPALANGIGGACSFKGRPNRDPRSKWHASVKQHPAKFYYPFCLGPGYVGGIEAAKGVAKIHTHVPFFHLEDVFVGMCLQKVGLRVIGIPNFEHSLLASYTDCYLKSGKMAILHSLSYERMERVSNLTKC